MPSSSAPDLVGQVVMGRYRVVAQLATGATADVFEAEHVDQGTPVALKVLRTEHQDSEVAARFLREGKTLGLFAHPHIVELLEVGKLDDGGMVLVTELVRGVSLRTVIEVGHVDPRRALAIIRQVLDALGHAHAMGIFHRDIRPENIMLTRAPAGDHVKMLDFGTAKLVADTATVLGEAKLTKAGFTAFGDPRYIAPECVRGGTIDGRADLYSAGAVLYELLTGQPPFLDKDPNVLMRLQAYAPVPKLSLRAPDLAFTPQIEFLVGEALAKTPDVRFRSAAEMITALDAALHSLEPLPAPAEPAKAEPPAPEPEGSLGWLAKEYAAPAQAPVASVPLTAPGLAPSPATRAMPEAPPRPPREPREPRAPGVPLRERVRRVIALARAHRRASLAAAGAFVVLLVVIVLVAHHKPAGPQAPSLAERATALLKGGDAKHAIDLLEGELAHKPGPQDAPAYRVLGDARLALDHRLDALAAYERALQLSPELGKDKELRASIAGVLDTRDTAAAMVALELLATRVKPPALDVIVAQAAANKVADIRHRALAIAERDGAGDKVDRVASWALDLAQATTCDDRRAAIARLAATHDKRAIDPIRRARSFECTAQDADDALTALSATR